jgi:hypothetical protein
MSLRSRHPRPRLPSRPACGSGERQPDFGRVRPTNGPPRQSLGGDASHAKRARLNDGCTWAGLGPQPEPTTSNAIASEGFLLDAVYAMLYGLDSALLTCTSSPSDDGLKYGRNASGFPPELDRLVPH